MTHDDLLYEVETRMASAHARYGDFASTHEALGVAVEEWDELRAAIQGNFQFDIERECIDLAAVLIRLARMVRNAGYMHERSMK
jgi:hypothetical protein